jgi:protein gp37
MAQSTKIRWTNATWNPITGCTMKSEGCHNCYAKRMAARLMKMGVQGYANGFNPTMHPDRIDVPKHWRKPCMIFVVSMGDIFHEDIPLHFQQQIFETIISCPQHTFQILTKRPEVLVARMNELPWPDNLLMGVTVENDNHLDRIDLLAQVPAKRRFLSIEPMLSPMRNLNLSPIDWVIVGGESGKGFRPMEADWVRDVRDQCLAARVKFFFKQWAGVRPKHPAMLDGKRWEEML